MTKRCTYDGKCEHRPGEDLACHNLGGHCPYWDEDILGTYIKIDTTHHKEYTLKSFTAWAQALCKEDPHGLGGHLLRYAEAWMKEI